jgi:hypothetical protein
MAGTGLITVTPVAQIIIAIVPIVGIVMGAIVIFFYLLWRHREIVRLIATGSYRKPDFDLHLFTLLAGFLLTGIGFVLSILFLIIEGVSYSLLGGLIPFALGISLFAFWYVTRPKKNHIDSAQ